MSNFSRVGDCFDPVVDPAFDCNPFWIAIRKVRIAILKKRSRSAFFRLRSAIQIATWIVSFFKRVSVICLSTPELFNFNIKQTFKCQFA